MRTLIIAAALMAGAANAGQITVTTEGYRIIGHGCAVDVMAWIEPPGVAFGKAGARSCTHYTFYLSGRPAPAQIEPNATAALADFGALYFECMLTGISNDPYAVDLWCADDGFFRGRR